MEMLDLFDIMTWEVQMKDTILGEQERGYHICDLIINTHLMLIHDY